MYMNFKSKRNNVTKSLYVLLALCVLGIVVLSVYSLFTQGAGDGNIEKISNNGGSDNNNLKAPTEDELMKIFGQTEKPTEKTTQPPTTEKKGKVESNSPVITPPVIPDNDEYEDEAANIEEDIIEEDINDVIAPEIPTEPAEAVEVFSAPSFFSKPVFGVISKNHNPDTPEFSVSMNDYRTHLGIDIEADAESEVKAIARGEVISVYDDPLMGKTVVIKHAGGYESVYMNLMENVPEAIKVGAMVEGGIVIGRVGNTALVETGDESHLHFAMTKDGEYVNPLHYVEY